MALNTITPLTEYAFKVASIDHLDLGDGKSALTITFEYEELNNESLSLANQSYEFIQTKELTEAGIAVQPYGALIINTLAPSVSASDYASLTLNVKTPGGVFESDSTISEIITGGIGFEVVFAVSESEGGGGEGGGGVG